MKKLKRMERSRSSAADSIGKLCSSLKQYAPPYLPLVACLHVIYSDSHFSSSSAFFKKSCEQVEVPVLQLLLWIRTRWASLYAFLDRLLILKKVSLFFFETCVVIPMFDVVH